MIIGVFFFLFFFGGDFSSSHCLSNFFDSTAVAAAEIDRKRQNNAGWRERMRLEDKRAVDLSSGFK